MQPPFVPIDKIPCVKSQGAANAVTGAKRATNASAITNENPVPRNAVIISFYSLFLWKVHILTTHMSISFKKSVSVETDFFEHSILSIFIKSAQFKLVTIGYFLVVWVVEVVNNGIFRKSVSLDSIYSSSLSTTLWVHHNTRVAKRVV